MAVPKGQVLVDAAVTATVAAMEAATDAADGAATAAAAQLAAITDAGSDAELHAQSVAPFTDSSAVNFDNGAKGYAAEADASATAAGVSEDAAATSASAAAVSAALAATRASLLAAGIPITYLTHTLAAFNALTPTNGETVLRSDTGQLFERVAGAWVFRATLIEVTLTSAASLDQVAGGAGARMSVYANGAGSVWDWQSSNPLASWAEAEDNLWVAASGSGFWIRRLPPGPVPLDVWGTTGAHLNTAILDVVATDLRRGIALPSNVVCGDSIEIFRDDTQSSVLLQGQGPAFWGEMAQEISGTALDFGTLTPDRFGLGVSTGRHVTVRDLSLVGPLDDYATAWVGDVISHLYSDYVADMGSANTSREAPLAGIVIDPYRGPTPGDPYPTTANYGQAGASVATDIDNVGISRFGIGVLVHPVNDAGTDTNSSEIQLRIDSHANAIGVSVGNTQARNIILKDLSNVSYGFVAVTGLRHGRRLGPLPRIRSLNTYGVYRLFEVNHGWGVVDVQGVHAEVMGEIGLFGTGTALRPMPGTIRGCHFDYWIDTASSISATPIFTTMVLAWEGNVHARVTSENDAAACTYNMAGGGFTTQTFRGDSFLFPDVTDQVCLFVTSTQRDIQMEGCYCATGQYRMMVNTDSAVYFPSSGSRRMNMAHWVRTVRKLSDDTLYKVVHGRSAHFRGVSDAIPIDSWNWGTATFHVTSADGQRLFVGDRILLPCRLDTDPAANPWNSGLTEYMPAAKITAYDTGTRVATFERLFHANALDETVTPTSVEVAVRLFAIDPALTADFANASPTVSLDLPAGVASDWFAAGDWVTTADGTTLPNALTRVVSVNDGAGQVTLTHNAAATVSNQAFYNTKLTPA